MTVPVEPSTSTPANPAMTASPTGWRRVSRFGGPLVVALVMGLYVACHVDPAGSYPTMPEGPGVTLDETFNVQQGVLLVEGLRAYGPAILFPENLREVFGKELHLPDHPPLGRFWLGLHHHVVWWFAPPTSPDGPFVTACARVGSATAFALTILLAGCFATIWYGEWAGLMTALGFTIVPRLIGHAHLASLETITNLTCTFATLVAAHYWTGHDPPTRRVAIGTGFCFGLALLTKIQGVLVWPPVALLAILLHRRPGFRPLMLWSLTGCVVFFLGWPWLWLDPVAHLSQYLRGAADRVELGVWYLGERYTDRTVTWVYSWKYFWWTMPLKLTLIGLLGSWGYPEKPNVDARVRNKTMAKRLTPREMFLFIAALWPLVFFSLPGVPIYDCERLWLPAVPVWMVLVGRGSDVLLRRLNGWWRTTGPLLYLIYFTLAIVQAVILLRYAPVQLCYYSGTAWGAAGAGKYDLERDYWGVAITRSLWEEVVRHVPRGATLAVTPVLHQFQLAEYQRQSPLVRGHELRLEPYDPARSDQQYVLTFQRRADLPAEFLAPDPRWELLAETELDGLLLAGLYRRVESARP
jgi:hypothetical protein